MTRDDIIRMAREAEVLSMYDSETGFCAEAAFKFATLVASAERKACVNLLMGLHNAQSNNGNHNYYHFAANAIKELRVKL